MWQQLETKKTSKMKKIFLVLFMALALVSCNVQLTEKVESKYPDGKPKLVRYYDKQDNCVKETEYYDSGEMKMEGRMKDGKREGEWKAYLRDGRPWSIDTFKDGELEGPSTVYWENGNLRWEGNYKAGVHCGHWKFYDEQGSFVRDKDYGPCE